MATAKTKDSKADPNRIDLKEQARLFDEAKAKFLKRDFAGAREVFRKATTGPDVALAHAAAMHVNMCDRRLNQPAAPTTPEEHYTAGVAALNGGSLVEAERLLTHALKSNDQAGHYHYALALCLGLKGDLDGCHRHLARAIDLEPDNRITARNDSDFQMLARQSPIKELLHAEKNR
jgi:tetratricopeptide (TPR) repeat protein